MEKILAEIAVSMEVNTGLASGLSVNNIISKLIFAINLQIIYLNI